MSRQSFMYRHIYLYRLVMSMLYTGSYQARLKPVLDILGVLKPASVLELCFGDIYIAAYCRARGITWTGIDINTRFVNFARNRGYEATTGDVLKIGFPETEVCIITGSLYHFQQTGLQPFLEKVFRHTDKLIVSEPVINLSSDTGVTGTLARKFSRTRLAEESFRYTRKSLTEALDQLAGPLHFRYRILSEFKKDMIILVENIN
ncbi:MAG TPA: class I SAM-dependent methyltransferase [Bacteroidia bacterium]|jgi:hypothetical protein|nr:class I SAM-dependent methyltransferase [Bacteroidia bacterium]